MKSSAGAITPDLSQAVLGFRVWEIADERWLRSPLRGQFWHTGVNEARCENGPAAPHLIVPPLPHCTCGLYAFNSMSDLAESCPMIDHPLILGAVAAWGPMEVYATGFRARFGRVLGVATIEDEDPRPAATVAKHYRVPSVEVQCLEMVSLPFAQPLPLELIPQQPLIILVIDCGLAASHPIVWNEIRRGCLLLASDVSEDAEVAIVACGREVHHWTFDPYDHHPGIGSRIRLLTCSDARAELVAGVQRARLIHELEGRGRRTNLIVVAAELPVDSAAFDSALRRAGAAGIEISVVAPMSLDDWPLWLSATASARWVSGVGVDGLADEIARELYRLELHAD